MNYDKLTYAGNPDSLESVMDDPLQRFVQGDLCDRAAVAAVLNEYRPIAGLNSLGKEGLVE